MKKLLILSLLIGMTLSIRAHNPQISTLVLVQQPNKQWHLMVGSSLSAFQYALQSKELLNPSDTIQASTFQALLLNYLRDHIQLSLNDGQPLKLTNGMMIVNHQTDVRFDVPGMPQHLQSLVISQQSFVDLKHHYCLLKISPYGGTSSQFILQHNNHFTVSLRAEGNHLTAVSPPSNQYGIQRIALGSGIALLGLFLYTQRKKRRLAILSHYS